jgi:Fur family zinc uptake transcriptional regulator
MTVESMTVESLTEQAKRICINKGVRFTAIREKVFRLMAETQTGMGAYDLLDKLKETEPNAKPATIYRALDFLSELGFIHKIESSNAFMLCHHFDHSHPVQLFICDNCGHVDEFYIHFFVQLHLKTNLKSNNEVIIFATSNTIVLAAFEAQAMSFNCLRLNLKS